MNTPCKEDGVCVGVNAECVRGRCRCLTDYILINDICGMTFSMFIYNTWTVGIQKGGDQKQILPLNYYLSNLGCWSKMGKKLGIEFWVLIYLGMTVKIQLCHFPHHVIYSILYPLFSITLAQACSCIEPSLAFATGPTSTHQRVTWSGLYRKLIEFLCIVGWHMRVSTRLLEVTWLECELP